jgi:hypothetical protein
MDYKILIFISICIVVLISGCTSLDSNLTNSTADRTNSSLNLKSLDSINMTNTIPISMIPGSSYDVTITMENTGTKPWSASNNITLSLVNDSTNDAFLFSNNTTQYFIKPKSVTSTNVNYTWSFTIIAPSYPYNYTLMYRMLANNSTWFGDTLKVNVNVGNYKGPVSFVMVNIPTSMVHGTNYTTSIIVQNTGKEPWLSSDRVALGAVDYEKNDVYTFSGNQRYYLNPGSSISPGKQCEWKFWLISPQYPGDYQLKYRMITGKNEWFGNMLNLSVHVS